MTVGIDIENINNFPNYKIEKQFFKDNYSSIEIEYALDQNQSNIILLSMFCLKEAIVKADNSFKSKPFKNIIIHYNESNLPMHEGFELSASFTKDLCVATALRI
tara:strand:+ start:155 stop:466 length:312 start_codon:yes stop_codon:yes gene_type:complete